MSAPALRSYRDVIDLLDDWTGGTAQAATQRDIRASVQLAWMDLCNERKWRYYQRKTRIFTQAPFNDGTVQYIAATNQLILTPNTSTGWPSWASQGSVLINNVISDVISVANDGVTATLDAVNHPDTDIAAGTGYQLFQDQYLLPADFHMADMPIAEGYLRASMYCNPQSYMAMNRIRQSSGTPVMWTIMASPRYMGSMVMAFAPWPYIAFSEDFIYTGRARDMNYTGFGPNDAGTCTAAAGTNIVNATNGSVFEPGIVGALVRFRQDSNTPDGQFGLNPFSEQRVVAAYNNPTQIALDANLANSYTNNAYVVSDPVDFAPHMFTSLFRGAQLQLAIQRKMNEVIPLQRQLYQDALEACKDAEEPVAQRRSCWDVQGWQMMRRIARWPYNSSPGPGFN